MNEFWENNLPVGYYDKVLTSGLVKNKGIQANWHNLTFSKVRQYIEKDDLHLDYACGPGTFIGNYKLNNSIGVDISLNQINFANQKYHEKGDFFTLDDISFNSKKFDSITVIGLLEFLNEKDSIDILNYLYSILKTNGKLILTTPNYSVFMYILEIILNIFGPINYKNQHINRLNRKKLNNIIKQTNFEKIKIMKIVNFSVFLSFINISFANKLEKIVEKIFQNKFGFIFLGILKK
tara:strand:+ start:2871 stop:3578 length:708 start_codon:yes stop_codon:yes gene_type:complete